MRKTTIAGIGLLLLALGLAPLGPGAAVSAQEEDKELDGKALLMEHKCNLCHAVPAAEIEAKTKSEAMKGPELGGKIEVEFEELAPYLRQETVLEGKGKHKKGFKGTDEELQAIIDWLGSLEAEE